MKLGIMQPYFMPYIGYWQRIKAVDKHVIYDDVNYIKGGWINRNRIICQGEVRYFNLPLRGASPNKLINEVEVDTNPVLQKKMLKTLEYAYRKAPNYSQVIELLKDIIITNEKNLAKYLKRQICILCDYMGIDTEIVMSSDIEKNNALKGEDKVIEICRNVGLGGGLTYYNASTGEHLYSRKTFVRNGFDLVFIKDAGSITYQQLSNTYTPALSIIDVLMNCTEDTVRNLLSDYETYQCG